MWNICICYKCMCIWQTYWKSGFDYMEICKSVFIFFFYFHKLFQLCASFRARCPNGTVSAGSAGGESPPRLISEVDSTVGQTAGCVVLKPKPTQTTTCPHSTPEAVSSVERAGSQRKVIFNFCGFLGVSFQKWDLWNRKRYRRILPLGFGKRVWCLPLRCKCSISDI